MGYYVKVESDEGAGKTILFIHGWLGSHKWFRQGNSSATY